MSCSSPGLVHFKDGRDYLVPCRGAFCEQCLEDRVREWSDRMAFDIISHGKNRSAYVTLTYDDDNLPLGGSFRYEDVQNFHYNLRDRLRRRYSETYRCICACEYGDDLVSKFGSINLPIGRPHYHLVLSGVDYDRDRMDIIQSWQHKCVPFAIKIEPVLAGCVRYCLYYNFKLSSNKLIKERYDQLGLMPPMQKFSKNIGFEYFDAHRLEYIKNGGFYYKNGKKRLLPKTLLDRYSIKLPDNNVSPEAFYLRKVFGDKKSIQGIDYKKSEAMAKWLQKSVNEITSDDFIRYRRAIGAHHEKTIANYNAMFK